MNIDPQQLHTYLKDAKQSGIREERERIIKMLLDGWVKDARSPLIKAIEGKK